MKTLAELMSVYHHHHTKKITKFTHFIGVPMIIFAIEILLSWPQIANIPLSWIAVIILGTYYLYLDAGLGIATGLFLVISNYFATLIVEYNTHVAITVFVLAFAIGWVIQLVGHYFEGRRPAFLENFFQVFVAPIFLVAECFFALGYKKDLHDKVAGMSK